MSVSFDISFTSQMPAEGELAILARLAGDFAAAGASVADPQNVIARAEKTSAFSGKSLATLDILAPHGSGFERLVVLGLGKPDKLNAHSWLKAGGVAASKCAKATSMAICLDAEGAGATAASVADFALGMHLRGYSFDKYKTRKQDDDKDSAAKTVKVTLVTAHAREAVSAYETAKSIADGVILARDLVNEPANVLGPLEFAAKAKALEALGVEVEILTEKEMTALGMGALLAVGQGSVRPPRMAVMQWNGGKAGEKPIAFVGKGVVFDTGGISIKPAGGMEDMKGDMGGAAAVTGLMHVLAARKAKVNAVGVIGIVENMPDGNAYRPGDVVTSMSGQTIEVLNTDAEGRLVLGDALWYCNGRFEPKFMINLATLTGAIGVALGPHHAGLFSNDDDLSEKLLAAGVQTAEKLWRMPLGSEYDKMIDSKIADMKNTGGRQAGSITAAQFLKRFVKDTPWAHLDVASTAMGSPADEISQSWASGFGVRLLNELVRAHYES
jgi:leucyl aminopeptidase